MCLTLELTGRLCEFQYTVNGGHLQHENSLPRDINGIHVEMRGISLFYVTIAEINLVLTYTGEDYSWSLSVPYSRYFNKTEGLCGKISCKVSFFESGNKFGPKT